MLQVYGATPACENNEIFNVKHLSARKMADSAEIVNAYPNPFNPTTYITFGIKEDNMVSATIYDLNGRLVATLLEEHLMAGYHEIIWNASSYSSGIYLLSIQTESHQSTHKLMLMK